MDCSDLFPAELASAQAAFRARPRKTRVERQPDVPVYLDDEEIYGELAERIDPQTGYVERRL